MAETETMAETATATQNYDRCKSDVISDPDRRTPVTRENMITRIPVCASVLAHSYYRKLGNVNAAP